jgi:hypothetical protein
MKTSQWLAKSILAALAILVVSSVTQAGYILTDKIANGSFADDLSGANVYWTSYGGGYNRTWYDRPAPSAHWGIVDTYGWSALSGIKQDITVAPNTDYKLTYWVPEGNLGGGVAEILAVSTLIASQSVPTTTQTSPVEFLFNSGNYTTLTVDFHAAGVEVGRYYLVLDEVKLYESGAVPEPAAIMLLLVGGAVVGLRRHSRAV